MKGQALRRLCAAVILSMLAGASAIAAEALPGATVESLLSVARERNPDLAAAHLEAEAAGERIQPAGALPDPVLRVELENLTNSGTTGLNLSPARVGDTRYTLMQALPFPGKRDLRQQAATSEADQARQQAQDTWVELSARLKSAYAEWWLNARYIALNRELQDLVRQLEQIAQTRYAGGLAPQQDAIRAQVERTGLLTDGVELEHERHRLAAVINGLLARPAGAPLADAAELTAVPRGEMSAASLMRKVEKNSPALAAEESRIQAARAQRALTYRDRYPDFNLGVVPMQIGNGIDSWGLMLEVNLPTQQETRRSREREAEKNVSAAETRKAALENRLQSDLEVAAAALQMSQDTEHLVAGSLLPQAELSFRAALAGYENGKLDFATLLDAQRQVRLAKQNLYKAQAAQRSQLADIERIVGEAP